MFTPVETAIAIMRLKKNKLLPKFILLAKVKKSTTGAILSGNSDGIDMILIDISNLKKKRKKDRVYVWVNKHFYKEIKNLVGKKNVANIVGFNVVPYDTLFDIRNHDYYTENELKNSKVLVIEVIGKKKKNR